MGQQTCDHMAVTCTFGGTANMTCPRSSPFTAPSVGAPKFEIPGDPGDPVWMSMPVLSTPSSHGKLAWVPSGAAHDALQRSPFVHKMPSPCACRSTPAASQNAAGGLWHGLQCLCHQPNTVWFLYLPECFFLFQGRRTCCPMGEALSLKSAQDLKHKSLRVRLPPGPLSNLYVNSLKSGISQLCRAQMMVFFTPTSKPPSAGPTQAPRPMPKPWLSTLWSAARSGSALQSLRPHRRKLRYHHFLAV